MKVLAAVAAVLAWAIHIGGFYAGWWTPRPGRLPLLMGCACGVCGGIGIVVLISTWWSP